QPPAPCACPPPMGRGCGGTSRGNLRFFAGSGGKREGGGGLTWTPSPVDSASPAEVSQGAVSLCKRADFQRAGDLFRARLLGRRTVPAAALSDGREVDDLRVRREADRAGLVQFQPALLFDRARLRHFRGRDRVHVSGRGGLQVVPGPRTGPARVRGNLR